MAVIIDSRHSGNQYGNQWMTLIDRVHIFDIDKVEATYFEKGVVVATPIKEELFGMKICALIDRGKPRDLYDVNNIIAMSSNLDVEKLRKSVLFYLSLDGIFDINESTFKKVEAITLNEIKRELLPVLAKRDRFDLKEAKTKVMTWLKELLSLTDKEKQYLVRFSNGEYNPFLLFDDNVAEKILQHPMAKWRTSYIEKTTK